MMKAIVTAFALTVILGQPAPAQSPPTRKLQKAQSRFSLDTSIAQILAHPKAKAALVKTMPTVAASPHLDQFRQLSMRQLALNPHAVLSASKMKALETELAKIK